MDSIEKNATLLSTRTYTEDHMMHGRYPKILEQIVIDTMNDHEYLASKAALETPENLDYLARLVLSLAHEREGEEVVAG